MFRPWFTVWISPTASYICELSSSLISLVKKGEIKAVPFTGASKVILVVSLSISCILVGVHFIPWWLYTSTTTPKQDKLCSNIHSVDSSSTSIVNDGDNITTLS